MANCRHILSFILLILLLTITRQTWAQQAYTLQYFNNENGLPVNSVKGLEWDEEYQLLWIGTEAGLVRWDGQHFTLINQGEGRVIEMGTYQDHGHPVIYTTTEGDHIYLLHKTKFRYEATQRDVLLYDAYMPSSNNRQSFLFNLIDRKQNKHIWMSKVAILDTACKEMLVYYNQQVYYRQGSQVSSLLHIAGTSPRFFKRGKTLMFADDKDLYTYLPGERRMVKTPVKGLPAGTRDYTIIVNTNDDYPIISTANTLYRLIKNGEELHAKLLYDGIPHLNTLDIVRWLGNTGYIAIGNGISGLYLLKRNSIVPVATAATQPGVEPVVTYGQAVLPGNRILTNDGVIIDRSGVVTRNSPLYSIFNFQSTASDIVYSTGNVVYSYNKATGNTTSNVLTGLSDWIQYAVVNGDIHVINSYGIYRLSGGHLTRIFILPPGPDGRPLRLASGAATNWGKDTILIGARSSILTCDLRTQHSKYRAITRAQQYAHC